MNRRFLIIYWTKFGKKCGHYTGHNKLDQEDGKQKSLEQNENQENMDDAETLSESPEVWLRPCELDYYKCIECGTVSISRKAK